MPQPPAAAFAHSHPVSEWERLEDHLLRVSELAAEFARPLGFADWARLAGLWHDLGKYSAEFQERLRGGDGAEATLETQPGQVDHSTAGAQHAAAVLPRMQGLILAYCIAGHHAGLPDYEPIEGTGYSGLAHRLRKKIPVHIPMVPVDLLTSPVLHGMRLKRDSEKGRQAFQLSVFCRMLFSCLVDADFLATEEFLRPEQGERRRVAAAAPAQLDDRLTAYLESLSTNSPVNAARAAVLAQCRAKASLSPGFFSLTVPTGGGKTLSSLAFALSHAINHGLRRIIYAIPFTSIIEQNADVFRRALGDAAEFALLEHHSNIEPQHETLWGKLASENWDAPIVVTTNVQLFEALFSNRPSTCRKLHRVARSVIILDECQTLPVELLAPTLRMLEELCRNYGCSVVLCSATQPAVGYRPGFDIGFRDVHEIVDDPQELYKTLRRVDMARLGVLDDAALVARLAKHAQALCVVNTRPWAARLFSLLLETRGKEGVFHLSAAMCAEHRTEVLKEIRERLDSENPRTCLVVSTQLIEAGVDVDFPVVYRALAGLDSIAQSAGRCNREGRRPRGFVYVFESEEWQKKSPLFVQQGAQRTHEVVGIHDDPLSLEAMECYFQLSYWGRRDEWDKEGILGLFQFSGDEPYFQFREASKRYQLIKDSQQQVLVPYDRAAKELIEELHRRAEPPGRDFHRRVQRYVVGVYEWELQQLLARGVVTRLHDHYFVLMDNVSYDSQLGLVRDVASIDVNRFYL